MVQQIFQALFFFCVPDEIAQLKEAVFNLQMAQKDNKELSKALRLEKSKNLKVRKNYRRLFTDVKRMEASVSVVLRLLNFFLIYVKVS